MTQNTETTANSQEPTESAPNSAFISDGKLPQQTSQPTDNSQEPTEPAPNSAFIIDGKLPQSKPIASNELTAKSKG